MPIYQIITKNESVDHSIHINGQLYSIETSSPEAAVRKVYQEWATPGEDPTIHDEYLRDTRNGWNVSIVGVFELTTGTNELDNALKIINGENQQKPKYPGHNHFN